MSSGLILLLQLRVGHYGFSPYKSERQPLDTHKQLAGMFIGIVLIP